MKDKFLLILRELERRYSLPFLWWPGRKEKLGIDSGICYAMKWLLVHRDLKWYLTKDEQPFFNIILNEEAEKYGAYFGDNSDLFWKAGQIKPRLKTIRAMISRIENS